MPVYVPTMKLPRWLLCHPHQHCISHARQAMAAHNSGGLVIVQVERVVERGSLPPRHVHLPGRACGQGQCAIPTNSCPQHEIGQYSARTLTEDIMPLWRSSLPWRIAATSLCSQCWIARGDRRAAVLTLEDVVDRRLSSRQPEMHWQTLACPQYDGSLSGQWRRPSTHQRRLPMDERKVIAHRAMLEIDRPHAIVNLGIGMPEVMIQCKVPTPCGNLVSCSL